MSKVFTKETEGDTEDELPDEGPALPWKNLTPASHTEFRTLPYFLDGLDTVDFGFRTRARHGDSERWTAFANSTLLARA